MNHRAKIKRLSQPLRQQRQALHDAFFEEMVNIALRLEDEGLYTVKEIGTTLSTDEWSQIVTTYDFDHNGGRLNELGVALEDLGCQKECTLLLNGKGGTCTYPFKVSHE